MSVNDAWLQFEFNYAEYLLLHPKIGSELKINYKTV